MKLEGKTQGQVDADTRARDDEAAVEAAKSEALALNLEALRPLIAITAGTATKEDTDKVKEIEKKLISVRNIIKAKNAKQ
jgi:hypothetical protein